MKASESVKASEIRVKDALVDILTEVEANQTGTISSQRMVERIQLHLELMASRLLTDSALYVNRNFDKSRHDIVLGIQEV